VFCGAKSGDDPRWVVGAYAFGEALARRGWSLVYGGGGVGLMGALADGALAAGGEVVGVIPHRLLARELAHRRLHQLEVVEDMAQRKLRMIAVADAFAALPGGLGTLDELFEVLTLRQIGEHAKPAALYNQDGYWDAMLAACRGMVRAGFVHARDLDPLICEPTIDAVLDALERALARPAAA
jgi:hypothetical protein